MIRVAPEGRPFILGAGVILAGLLLAQWWIGALIWLPIAIWVVAFFRDPVRQGPRGEQYVIAPADGRVVGVIEVDEPKFFAERAQRISIFMNVFDVHVNRYPVSGRVEYRDYTRGRFGHAAEEKASLANEQASVGLGAARGRILVRQIAGLIARRIVTDHEVGATVEQGERMGMIRFGSRVDVFLPRTVRILVKDGDRTKAGSTVVAEWS